MVDFADQASMASQGHLADALRKRERERMSAPAESAHGCEECGEIIPEARRQAVQGCTRCIECQTIYDKFR
jgi:phage/conjugal plasmid C-4 type zinc finger TraR family protein